MDEIRLPSFLPLDPVRNLLKVTHAQAEPTYRRVQKSTLILGPSGPLGLYFHPEESVEELRLALKGISYSTSARTRGLTTHSRTFGNAPRIPIRADYCHCAALAREDPHAHGLLTQWAGYASSYFEKAFPQEHTRQRDRLVGAVRPEWRLPGDTFTSGIINANNYLAYHLDTGNFPDSWSAMLVLREYTEGGELVVPEWGLTFECADRSMLLFDGSRWLHGVAPMRRLSEAKSYRYSIVWYALKFMANCLSPEEELLRIRTKKTERERARLDPVATAERIGLTKAKRTPTP